MAAKHAELKKLFTRDVQIHFLSCLVGLGTLGDNFTKGIASLFISDPNGRVQTSTAYGLGDWSIPQGMGFWDYLNDEQLEHDNEIYPIDKMDSEQMQQASIRVAGNVNGATVSNLMPIRFFMFMDGRDPGMLSASSVISTVTHKKSVLPGAIRIPGTRIRIPTMSR